MVHAQIIIRPGEWDAYNSQGFRDTNTSLHPGQKTGCSDNQQKLKICRQEDFAFPADNRVKIKKNKKKASSVRELKEL